MADSLLRVFDSFDVACRARDALLEAGVAPEAIHMRPLEDDGGPVQGNFIIDLRDAPTPPRGSQNRQSAQSELRTPVQRNTCLMRVDLKAESQGVQIAGILDQFAAQDRGDRLDSRHRS
ncbi:hypothetical protein [Massilia endophytica]|uniref:hypothetical protein n=1 Tax=Massilia endophytica TaxID=2899220 RepID=UPI001E3E2176|nr:hypothetical protein [Massilia endophytica]UGQ46547.1 hypothetical protein LSQ66_22730 [Massilia endophytica]